MTECLKRDLKRSNGLPAAEDSGPTFNWTKRRRCPYKLLLYYLIMAIQKIVPSVIADVEELLGRPIQEELAMETGTDVALDALIDVSTEAIVMSERVKALLTSCAETLELVAETRERLADLNLQVDVFRLQCPSRYRPLCDTVDTGGLDLVSDDRLAKIKGLGDGNLSLETQQARGQFHFIPQRVEKETRNARNGVKRQLTRQKEVLYDSIWSLDVITRDIAYKSEDARNKVLQIAKEISTIDQWRWFIGFGSAMSVTLVWLLLVYGISCGCCGSQKRATHILLASVVLMCIFSVALWGVALGALFVGGHGEVFVCRPLYDEPEFSTLTHLVDQPSVLFQKGGGFFSNLLYGNSTMDVPIRDVLQKCKKNGSAYSTFRLKQVFDMDAATNHKRWDLMHAELERLHVNLTNLQLLTPGLQYQLQALLHATTVNLTNHRTQMSGQVTGKDLSSFADQMTSVANQITDMSTLSRLDTLASTTRQLVISHIQPLERHKVDLVYQLTALEMKMVPLQRQVNQSLSHLKTIQYFINNQGSNIAYECHQALLSTWVIWVPLLNKSGMVYSNGWKDVYLTCPYCKP
ncbi:Prominin-1-A [Zootermopsis nevadensis]|uniref:Prominin-1-A n=1 Tax=Zootermopsis nevadensis TaxID=136037 RepID=A0A067QVM0_ZOONE|nr:Prominin-1-A [Zootermopsis nevadensis]